MPYVCTVNEPQILPLFGYLTGQNPPGDCNHDRARRVNTTLIAAHRRAVATLRVGASRSLVGTCLQLVPMDPLREHDAEDRALTHQLVEMMTEARIDDLRRG